MLAHFPRGHFGPRLGRRSTATTFTLELAVGTIKSGRGSKKKQCQMQQITHMILCGIQSHSLNCSQKDRDRSSSLHVRMCALVLARCSNCGGPLCKGTFSTGLSGLVHEPAKPSKAVSHSIETISTVALCSCGYCRNHVGTMNGAVSGILGAGHGMAERCRMSVKIVACPCAWVLNSVAKFVNVQTEIHGCKSHSLSASFATPVTSTTTRLQLPL